VRDEATGKDARTRSGGVRLAVRGLLLIAPWLSVLAVAATAGAAGTPNPPNVFNTGGAGAEQIRRLAFEVFGILSIVLLTVWIVLAFVIIRYRRRPESEASQTEGDLRLEILWTVIPLIIVSVILALTLRTTEQLINPDPTVHITSVGHQWWWEFDFGPQHFKTANEIDVPVGQTLAVRLLSADVIHGFWVPQLGGKTQMIPGSVNHTSLTPVALGKYRGECANFCGVQHAHMDFVMNVVTPAEYVAWLAHQEAPAATATGTAAVAGARLMPTIACGGCHTVRGTTMHGTFGPDLTHFGSRGGIGAYVVSNTPANLLKWIQNPQAVKPRCVMPQIPLPLLQQRELVAYLEELQ
jgi:cytochrome c oxidase subunit II